MMKPGLIIVALLVVSIVSIGFSSFQSDIASNYGVTAKNMTYLSAANQTQNQLNSIRQTIENSTVQPSFFVGLTGAWSALTLMFAPFNIVNTLITDVSAILGIPVWASSAIAAIVFALITFAILSAIFKWELI
jgi:hypothetical protein